MSRTMKVAAAILAATTVMGTMDEAFAMNRFTHTTGGYRHYGHRRGIGAGGVVAGAALGILGAATAGIAADRYYNGYPSYSYGPGYGSRYGYDYHGDRGYYGPY